MTEDEYDAVFEAGSIYSRTLNEHGGTVEVFGYEGGFIFNYGGAEMQCTDLYGKLLADGKVVPFATVEEAVEAATKDDIPYCELEVDYQ